METGLVLTYTGDGKGKTTAAMGLAIRALGQGLKPVIIQFIKSPKRAYGEKNILEQLGVEIVQMGEGFTWLKTPEVHREAMRNAWKYAKEKLLEGDEDVIILDEINNALAIESFEIGDVLPLAEVMTTIKNRRKGTTVVITGRSAKKEIIEISDLVTEMKPIKHYYEDGIPAVKGIEF